MENANASALEYAKTAERMKQDAQAISDSSCSLCQEILRDSSAILNSAFFHELCPRTECSTANEDELLCTFCQHLRPRHLLTCVRISNWRLPFYSLRLGILSDIRRRQSSTGCVFCNFLLCAANRVWPFHRHSERLYLRSFTPDGYSLREEMANIVLQVERQFEASETTGRGYVVMDVKAQGATVGRVPQRICWEQINDWVDNCHHGHSGCFPDHPIQVPEGFRLIDIKKRRLIRTQSPPSFVALSYVWGSNSDRSRTMAQLSNIQHLEKCGGLSSNLPTTIEDAIAICESMEESFLWVDILCIVQDDPENKQRQINYMNSIYASAKLVIVIASGDSMDEHVPGVSENRKNQLQLEVLGLDLTQVFEDPWIPLAQSTWSTRGWTYQEGILPKRKLYFMRNEIWYECEEAIRRENWAGRDTACMKNCNEKVGWTGGLFRFDHDTSWSFATHLQAFTGRSLTHTSDKLNAFAGIIRGLYGSNSSSLFGTPCADFDQSILWLGTARIDPGTESLETCTTPSWSWTSTEGQTHYLDFRYFAGTLVRWFQYVEANNTFQPLGPIREPYSWTDSVADCYRDHLSCQIILGLAIKEGCSETLPDILLDIGNQTFEDIDGFVKSKWPKYVDYVRDSLPKQFRTSNSSLVPLNSNSNPNVEFAGAIYTRAQSAHFFVKRHTMPSKTTGIEEQSTLDEPINAGERHKHEILDQEGQQIGSLKPSVPSNDYAVWREGADGRSTSFEFIGLSISYRCFSSSEDFDTPPTRLLYYSSSDVPQYSLEEEVFTSWKARDFAYFDKNGMPLGTRPVVNVMLIGRDDDGYSYRLGIGWILLTKWATAKRRFVDVALR